MTKSNGSSDISLTVVDDVLVEEGDAVVVEVVTGGNVLVSSVVEFETFTGR